MLKQSVVQIPHKKDVVKKKKKKLNKKSDEKEKVFDFYFFYKSHQAFVTWHNVNITQLQQEADV